MELTNLQKVAILAYHLGDGEEGMQKTAGIFGSVSRMLRAPFRGPYRQFGKELSEEIQKNLTGAVQKHALTAADPTTSAVKRWYSNWRAASGQKNLSKELSLYNKLLGADIKSLQGKIDKITAALNTPGLSIPAKNELNKRLVLYQQRLAGVNKNIQTNVTNVGRIQGQQTPSGGQQTPGGGQQTPGGGQQTPSGGQQTPSGGQQTPSGGQQTPSGGQQQASTTPSFFQQYAPGTFTRNVADYFFRDPAKAVAMGLGGAWGLNQVATPVVKNIFGVQER